MLRPIEQGARRALISGGLAIATCGLLVVPLAGSPSGYSSGVLPDRFKPAITQRDDPWKGAMVKVLRDPFLPEPTLKKPLPVSPLADNGRRIGMHVIRASVLGVAFGQKPEAVIEIEGAAKVVAPGDFIKGMRVVSIAPDRVVLSDGSVLMFFRSLP